MNKPFWQSYWDWVNMARSEGWSLWLLRRMIWTVFLWLLGLLGLFLRNCASSICWNTTWLYPRTRLVAVTHLYSLHLTHISCSQSINNIVESMREMSPAEWSLNLSFSHRSQTRFSFSFSFYGYGYLVVEKYVFIEGSFSICTSWIPFFMCTESIA